MLSKEIIFYKKLTDLPIYLIHLVFDCLWSKYLYYDCQVYYQFFLLLSQNLLSFILPKYVYTLFQRQTNSIYQCLVSHNCFQTKWLQFEFPSNSFRTLSSVLLLTNGVVPSAKLQIFMSCKKKKRSFK